MPKKTKKLGTNYPVPQSKEDCDAAIKQLGDVRRDIQRLDADMNDELASVKEKYEAKADPLRDKSDELLGGIETWCAANRDQLTMNGKVKYARFGNGEVKWRARPARVTIRGVDAVIENLASLGLQQFLRVKTEVNKDAILDDPEAVTGVKGVSVGSEGEDFVVEPFESEIAKSEGKAA